MSMHRDVCSLCMREVPDGVACGDCCPDVDAAVDAERARIAAIIREEIAEHRALLAEDSTSMTRTTIERIRIDALEGLLAMVEDGR